MRKRVRFEKRVGMTTDGSDAPGEAVGGFVTTPWSVVLAASREDTQGRQALARLCQTYWRPLYFFVRRRGYDPAAAEDLTQEFFARLIEKRSLSRADPGKGKFRAYLVTAMRHFLASEWERARAQKRGGGARLISLDIASTEIRLGLEPADSTSPENIREREWVLALLEEALRRLKEEQARAGKLEAFEVLRRCLPGDEGMSYSQLAARLGTTRGAAKMAVFRLRRRYARLVREEIAQTVGTPTEVEEEIQHLFAVLGSG